MKERPILNNYSDFHNITVTIKPILEKKAQILLMEDIVNHYKAVKRKEKFLDSTLAIYVICSYFAKYCNCHICQYKTSHQLVCNTMYISHFICDY